MRTIHPILRSPLSSPASNWKGRCLPALPSSGSSPGFFPAAVPIPGLRRRRRGSSNQNSTPVPTPTISSFKAAAGTVGYGGSTTLTAVFSNGTGSVDHGVGSLAVVWLFQQGL